MKIIKIYCTIIVLLISSCAVKEKAATNTKGKDQKESQFIYLFSEANKNRLLGNNKTAIEQYISALDINPKSAASNFYLATIFIIDNQFESAKSFSEKAVNLQPENLWYNLAYADILRSIGSTDQAITIYEKLSKKEPKNELIYNRLLDVYSQNSYQSKLIDVYKRKLINIDYNSNDALVLYNLYYMQKDFISAEKTLKELIKYEYSDPKYRALLAEYYLSTDQHSKAEAIYNELLKNYPENVSVRLSYAFYCRLIGNFKSYYIHVKFLINSEIDFHTKINLLISGQYPNFPKPEYIQLLNELNNNHPNEILSKSLLAEFYIDDKNNAKAIIYLREAVNLSNSDLNLILTLFELEYDEKQYDSLYKDSEKFLLIYPNQAKVFLYNGIGAYYLNNYDEAIKTLQMGKDLVIDDIDLELQFYYYLAESYNSIKNHVSSDTYFEKVLSLKNDFYIAMNSYSYYLSERNLNITKAINLAKQCFENNRSNPYFNHTYAFALFKNNDLINALTYSENAINILPNNFEFLETHGNILFALNKREEAVIIWKQSQKFGNQTEKIKNKIININSLTIRDL